MGEDCGLEVREGWGGGELVATGSGWEERGKCWMRMEIAEQKLWREEDGWRAMFSTTSWASRRTLHSKVSTQRASHEGGVHIGDATYLQPPCPPTMPARLPADSWTPVIYFSPPHLTGRLLPISQCRGSTLMARASASWWDTLCSWTQPSEAPFPGGPGASTSTTGDQLGSFQTLRWFALKFLKHYIALKTFKYPPSHYIL